MGTLEALDVSAAPYRAPVLLDVIEEHLEEFAFLSIQRRKMLFSSEVGQRGVRDLDRRLEAHHDGLRLAGPAGVEIAETRLEENDPWQRYAAARIWIEDGRPAARLVLEHLEGSRDEGLAAWREALRRAPAPVIHTFSPPAFDGGLARAPALLADACGWHGLLEASARTALASSDDADVRRAVARSLGLARSESPARDEGLLEELLRDPDRDVARTALWSLALRDPAAAMRRCRDALERDAADPFTVQTLGFLGDRSDTDRILPLIAPDATRNAAIRALGHLGDVSVVGLLLRLMESPDEQSALAASDAFETILGPLPPPPRTGLPSIRDAGPLPFPAVSAAEVWSRRAAGFDTKRRWLRGRPFPASIADAEEPMELQWLRSVMDAAGPATWLRHEVPDGFFKAHPAHEAIPGE